MSYFGVGGEKGGRESGRRNSNDFTDHILQISHLETLPNSNEAQNLLSRAARAVLPLLQRRKWKIGHLTEFYPNNPSLHGLNINQGYMIKVRLRTSERYGNLSYLNLTSFWSPYHSQHEFLPLDYIIGTLIHEITHISIGPHSAEFYRLMESLTAEVEQDLASGVDINGNLKFAAFTGVARKLGVSNSNSCGQTTPFDKKRLRDLQVEAASRREQNFNRAKGSGQVLGGRPSSNSSVSSGVPSSSRLLQMNQIHDTVGRGIQNDNWRVNQPTRGAQNLNHLPHNTEEIAWSCVSCTYENPPGNLQCEICGSMPRKGNSTSTQVWCCTHCTFENSFPLENCQICGSDRHVGIPISTNNPSSSASLPDIVILLEDDSKSPPPPSRRLRGRRGDDPSGNDVECLWICSMCQGANTMRETSCAICGYLA
jgi:DNA-dependent metalloprotease WSS1